MDYTEEEIKEIIYRERIKFANFIRDYRNSCINPDTIIKLPDWFLYKSDPILINKINELLDKSTIILESGTKKEYNDYI